METITVASEQAFDEWSTLVEREESAAYNVELNNDNGIQICSTEMREDICDWCYKLVDHCDIDRDIVVIAVSYFDLYLSKRKRNNYGSLIQLVAMTSLYLAIKVHSTKKISLKVMSSLSQGCFTQDHIHNMEVCLIQALEWYLNPPSPLMFLYIASPIIYASADKDLGTEAEDLARYMIELSVFDEEFFTQMKPSSIAFAAMISAMRILEIPDQALLNCHFEHEHSMTKLCNKFLRKVYRAAMPLNDGDDTTSNRGSSPTSVVPSDTRGR